jgi:uncharacterized protein YgiB involved in biofilm formation
MYRTVFIIAALSVSLAGCGGSPKKQAGPAAPAGIFTSANDCAESKKLTVAQCDELIRAAVADHQQTAKTYISLRLCEAAEGIDRCERTEENAFRPKLQAFLVTFSTPPSALALYPAANQQIGFATRDKARTVLAVDETLTFSENAKFVAEGNVN